MGFTEVLTIVFVILKLIDVIDWSWWLVLLPEIIAVGIYLIVFVIQLVLFLKVKGKIKKSFKDDDFFDKF